MGVPVDRPGTFRAQITEYGLKEMDSGSVAISLKATLSEMWDGDQWVEWLPYGMEAAGDIWVIKKDGKANEKAVESLIRYAGWDTSFSAITEGSWKPTACQVDIKEEEYQQKKSLRISFLGAYDRTPGAMGNVDATKAADLDNRFGGTLRALSANAVRNKAPAAGSKPPAPPPPAAPVHANSAPPVADEIPF